MDLREGAIFDCEELSDAILPVSSRRMENSEHSAAAVKICVLGWRLTPRPPDHRVEHRRPNPLFLWRALRRAIPGGAGKNISLSRSLPRGGSNRRNSPQARAGKDRSRPAPAGALSAEPYVCPMCVETTRTKPVRVPSAHGSRARMADR